MQPSEPAAAAPFASWLQAATLRCGRALSVSVANESDCQLLTAVLADSLATQLGAEKLRLYLQHTQVAPYVRARVTPCATDEELLMRGVLLKASFEDGTLAAVCELSAPTEKEETEGWGARTLAPPVGSALLSNVTVVGEHRRKGVATALLRAALEAAAILARESDVYLQARAADEAAGQLYTKLGFLSVDEHSLWEGLLRGRRPRLRLMRLVR